MFVYTPAVLRRRPWKKGKNRSKVLQLHIIVEQPNLFTGLEGWKSDIRTSVASESVAK
jgi:hypothetical protein